MLSDHAAFEILSSEVTKIVLFKLILSFDIVLRSWQYICLHISCRESFFIYGVNIFFFRAV